jgi:hypothetical protein
MAPITLVRVIGSRSQIAATVIATMGTTFENMAVRDGPIRCTAVYQIR